MTDLRCPACGNPSRDGGLCDVDEGELADVLKAAPDLLDELLIQATRQAVTSIGGRQGAETPLPINLKAADLASGYENLLVSWARACGGDDDPDLTGGGREAAAWLQERIYDVRIHEAAGDITAELTQHARACIRAIDRYGADLHYIGNCKGLLPPNDVACEEPLRVRLGVAVAQCRRCEARHDVAEMKAELDARFDVSLATAREIAAAGYRTPDGRRINVKVIEGYLRRGLIAEKGKKGKAGTFCIGDVKDAALQTRYPKARLTSGDARRSA